MTYAISDIHGCFEPYRKLLHRINFGDSDFLYVLGDAIDRGPDSIAVLMDVLSRDNAVYVPGNHDYFLRRLAPVYGFSRDEGARRPSPMDCAVKAGWMLRGGRSTLAQFCRLPVEDRHTLVASLESAPAWIRTSVGKNSFLLTHKVFPGFLHKQDFASLTLRDYLKPGSDYSSNPVPGCILISGHRCTMELRPDHKPLIFSQNDHVVIDCGICQGGALACYCLDNQETIYIPASYVNM